MSPAQYRHYGCRVTDDIVYKGMRALFLENEVIRVGVLLDKGADIFQFIHKPTDTDFLWKSPQGIIDPKRFTATTAASSGAFLDTYHGGWQEIFPGGGPAVYRGAELGLHGEVTHLSWDYRLLEDSPERIAVRLQVDCIRTPFRLERTMRLEKGTPTLFMEEKLTNLSPEPLEFMWGHHPSIGAPFLRKGVRLFIPAAKGEVHTPQFAASGILDPGSEFNWPLAKAGNDSVDLSRVPDQDAGFSELIYLKELSSGWYAVLDPERPLGIGFAWPKEVFPYLWFWFVYGRAPGYPWWDRVYCLALEPWTSIPNSLTKALERGTQARIEGGESLVFPLITTVITNQTVVKHIDLDGTVR